AGLRRAGDWLVIEEPTGCRRRATGRGTCEHYLLTHPKFLAVNADAGVRRRRDHVHSCYDTRRHAISVAGHHKVWSGVGRVRRGKLKQGVGGAIDGLTIEVPLDAERARAIDKRAEAEGVLQQHLHVVNIIDY